MDTALNNSLNAAELTTLHAEALAAARLARTLKNITRRARTLFTDGGYTWEKFAGKFAGGLFHVFGPEGQHYMTTCCPIVGYDCTCPAFGEYGTCKHLEAVGLMLREEAQAAEQDTRADFLEAHDDGAYAEF
jgi:uncharacterized Zn finger protein